MKSTRMLTGRRYCASAKPHMWANRSAEIASGFAAWMVACWTMTRCWSDGGVSGLRGKSSGSGVAQALRANQARTDCIAHQFICPFHSEFSHYCFPVKSDGLQRNVQGSSDFLAGPTLGDEANNLLLTLCQGAGCHIGLLERSFCNR